LSAQLNDLYLTSTYLIPWVTFLIALGGSLHCVGMCGGLVMAFAPTPKQNLFYQAGRFLSYIFLGVSASYFGEVIKEYFQSDLITLMIAILMGSLLIFWGVKIVIKSRLKLRLPRILNKIATKLYSIKQIHNLKNENLKSFLVGTLSIFLPCGFLYGLVLIVAIYNDPFLAAISMFSFWLGTIPAMAFAPSIFSKILIPLKNRAPLLSSCFLIIIGLSTISIRLYQYITTGQCH
jgi:sulfite exporter TauE/SafE